jgi:hypothetical protein
MNRPFVIPLLLALIASLLAANLVVSLRIASRMPPTYREVRSARQGRDTAFMARIPVVDVRSLHRGSVYVEGGNLTVDGSVEIDQ